MKLFTNLSMVLILGIVGLAGCAQEDDPKITDLGRRLSALEARPAANPPAAAQLSDEEKKRQEAIVEEARRRAAAALAPPAPRFNDWTRVGTNPFTGTPEEGLKLLGYSTEVQKKFLEAINDRRLEWVEMPDGVVYERQVFSVNGAHKAWNSVRQKLGAPLKGALYKVELAGVYYSLFYPPQDHGGCDNWSDMAAAEAAKATRIP